MHTHPMPIPLSSSDSIHQTISPLTLTPSQKRRINIQDHLQIDHHIYDPKSGSTREIIVIDDTDSGEPPPIPSSYTTSLQQNSYPYHHNSAAPNLMIPPLHSTTTTNITTNLSSPTLAQNLVNTNTPIPPPIIYPSSPIYQNNIATISMNKQALFNHSNNLVLPTANSLAASTVQPVKRRRRNNDHHHSTSTQHAKNAYSSSSSTALLQQPDQFIPPPPPPHPHPPINTNQGSAQGISSSSCDDKDGHFIITPGDILLNTYSIIKLLGQGTFGKVAECIDLRSNRRVAVKIVRAIQKYHDAAIGEIRVLNTLRCADLENRHQCVQLLSEFDFRKHKCMVFPLLGPSLFDFLKDNQFQPFTLAQVRELAIQLIDSVAFLHKLKIVHTDLKPENILLMSADSIKCAPLTTHLNMSRKVHPKSYTWQRVLKSFLICVIDFGSATFDNEYKSSVVSTRHYRAPEIMLELGWSFPCDMWSVGCILVELLIGEALFQTHENVEHLAMMEMILGMFQDELVTRSRKRSVWFHPPELVSGGPCGQQVRVCKVLFPAPDTKRDARTFVRSLRTLKEICDMPGRSRLNAGVVLVSHTSPSESPSSVQGSGKESAPRTVFTPPPADLVPSFTQFHSLIQRLLIFDPTRRLSARQALSHSFFDGIVHPLLRKQMNVSSPPFNLLPTNHRNPHSYYFNGNQSPTTRITNPIPGISLPMARNPPSSVKTGMVNPNLSVSSHPTAATYYTNQYAYPQVGTPSTMLMNQTLPVHTNPANYTVVSQVPSVPMPLSNSHGGYARTQHLNKSPTIMNVPSPGIKYRIVSTDDIRAQTYLPQPASYPTTNYQAQSVPYNEPVASEIQQGAGQFDPYKVLPPSSQTVPTQTYASAPTLHAKSGTHTSFAFPQSSSLITPNHPNKTIVQPYSNAVVVMPPVPIMHQPLHGSTANVQSHPNTNRYAQSTPYLFPSSAIPSPMVPSPMHHTKSNLMMQSSHFAQPMYPLASQSQVISSTNAHLHSVGSRATVHAAPGFHTEYSQHDGQYLKQPASQHLVPSSVGSVPTNEIRPSFQRLESAGEMVNHAPVLDHSRYSLSSLGTTYSSTTGDRVGNGSNLSSSTNVGNPQNTYLNQQQYIGFPQHSFRQ